MSPAFPFFACPLRSGRLARQKRYLPFLSLSLPRSHSMLFAFHLTRIRGSPVPCNWTAPCISEYKLAYFRACREAMAMPARLVSGNLDSIRRRSAASPHYLIDSSLINAALRLFNFTEASYACVVNCQPVKRTSRTMRDVETRMTYHFWQNRSRNIFNR